MSIFNFSTIEAGGTISFSLDDGTKVIDSPVRRNGTDYYAALGGVRICDEFGGTIRKEIASVDSYTPPAPAWAAPNVVMVSDSSGDLWLRHKHDADRWTCVTFSGSGNTPDVSDTDFRNWTTRTLEESYFSVRVYAIREAA